MKGLTWRDESREKHPALRIQKEFIGQPRRKGIGPRGNLSGQPAGNLVGAAGTPGVYSSLKCGGGGWTKQAAEAGRAGGDYRSQNLVCTMCQAAQTQQSAEVCQRAATGCGGSCALEKAHACRRVKAGPEGGRAGGKGPVQRQSQ